MEVRYVDAKENHAPTPFCEGGVYSHKRTKMVLMLARLVDGDPDNDTQYSLVNPVAGYFGTPTNREKAALMLQMYNFHPGAYIAIPKEDVRGS